MNSLALCLLIAGLFAAAGDQAPAGAAPEELQRLEFSFDKPRTIMIYPGGDEQGSEGEALRSGKIYWYLTYRLTNPGTQEARFFINISATSDKNKSYSDLALPDVEKKIEQVERRRLFSKADLLTDGKELDQYERFAAGEKRDCVAIFNPLDPEADTIVFMVHGLVNDLKMEDLGGGRLRVEERVLKITFKRPGDEFYTSLDQFTFDSKEWLTVTKELAPAGG